MSVLGDGKSLLGADVLQEHLVLQRITFRHLPAYGDAVVERKGLNGWLRRNGYGESFAPLDQYELAIPRPEIKDVAGASVVFLNQREIFFS